MNFETQIKEWVLLDDQYKSLQEKMKTIQSRRNSLSADITTYATTNNLFNSAVKISSGTLRFCNARNSQSLTFKYLEKCLGEIIKNDTQVQSIINYIKTHRETHVTPEIKRVYNN
jgi:seryl-tRNA synthetase